MRTGTADASRRRAMRPRCASRRNFLLSTAALAATMLAPGVTLYAMGGESGSGRPNAAGFL